MYVTGKLSRYNDESFTEPGKEPQFWLGCPVNYTGQELRPATVHG